VEQRETPGTYSETAENGPAPYAFAYGAAENIACEVSGYGTGVKFVARTSITTSPAVEMP